MVKVEKNGNHFLFTVQGMHKLWAVKSQLSIPAENIVKAYRNNKDLSEYSGWRMPGTSIPNIIKAGSYVSKDGTIFCDFTNGENIIVAELADEHYKKLVIEVENVDEALSVLNNR